MPGRSGNLKSYDVEEFPARNIPRVWAVFVSIRRRFVQRVREHVAETYWVWVMGVLTIRCMLRLTGPKMTHDRRGRAANGSGIIEDSK